MPSPCCWEECSEVFGHTDELIIHLSVHLGSPQDQCKWRGCATNLGENVTTAVVLRHVMVEHAALRPHHCSQCHKHFSAPNFLEIHIRVIHRKKVEICMCPLSDCRYNDTSLIGLQQHCLLAHGVQGICDLNAALFSNEIRKILPNHRIPTAFVQQSLTQILQLERRISPQATDETIDGLYNRMTIKLHETAVELATKERIMEENAKKAEHNAKFQQENVPPSCSKACEVDVKKEEPVKNVGAQVSQKISEPCEIQTKTAEISLQKKVNAEVVTLEKETPQNLDEIPSNSRDLRPLDQVQHKNIVKNGMEMNQNDSSPQDIDLKTQNSEDSEMKFVESPLPSSTSSSDGHVEDEPKNHKNGRFSPSAMLRIFGERLGGENHKFGRPDTSLSKADRRLIQEMEAKNRIKKRVTPEPILDVKKSDRKAPEDPRNAVKVPLVSAPTMTESGRMIFPPTTSVLAENENEQYLIPKAPGDPVYHKTIVNHKPNVIKVESQEVVAVDQGQKSNILPAERGFEFDEGGFAMSGSASLQSRARQISTCSSLLYPRPQRYRSASAHSRTSPSPRAISRSRSRSSRSRSRSYRSYSPDSYRSRRRRRSRSSSSSLSSGYSSRRWRRKSSSERSGSRSPRRRSASPKRRSRRDDSPRKEERKKSKSNKSSSPTRKSVSRMVECSWTRSGAFLSPERKSKRKASPSKRYEYSISPKRKPTQAATPARPSSSSTNQNYGQKSPEVIEISSDSETDKKTPASEVALPGSAASEKSRSQKRNAQRKRKKARERGEWKPVASKPSNPNGKARVEEYKQQLQQTSHISNSATQINQNMAYQITQFSTIPPKSAVLIMESAKYKSKTKLRTFLGFEYGQIRIFFVTFYGQPGYVIYFLEQAGAASFMQKYRDKELVEKTFGHMTLLTWYDEVKRYIELV